GGTGSRTPAPPPNPRASPPSAGGGATPAPSCPATTSCGSSRTPIPPVAPATKTRTSLDVPQTAIGRTSAVEPPASPQASTSHARSRSPPCRPPGEAVAGDPQPGEPGLGQRTRPGRRRGAGRADEPAGPPP